METKIIYLGLAIFFLAFVLLMGTNLYMMYNEIQGQEYCEENFNETDCNYYKCRSEKSSRLNAINVNEQRYRNCLLEKELGIEK